MSVDWQSIFGTKEEQEALLKPSAQIMPRANSGL
ncbi:unnamed protein product, partial [marine sediment metagenome]